MTAPIAERLLYADSSALVKLVVCERWSTDLAVYLNRSVDRIVSSALAAVEVTRALRVDEAGPDGERDAEQLFQELTLLDVDRDVLIEARGLAGPALGTLDAIHLASAHRSGAEVLVTYDRQLGRAARGLGLRVEAPGVE